jgi:hypothetical protein
LLGVADQHLSRDQAVRIIVRHPRPGFSHPLTPADLRSVLQSLGANATYGLRLIELAHAPEPLSKKRIHVGRWVRSGHIQLFEQRASPWRLAGTLNPAVAETLRHYGATLQSDFVLNRTTVTWPSASLRRWLLVEGFLHELGHHVWQHESVRGCRPAARTRDHEYVAAQLARRWTRTLWTP